MTQAHQSRFPGHFESIRNAAAPGKEFLIGERSLSYGELFDRLDRISAFFRACELEIGGRVLIACADDREVAALFLAALRSGLTTVVVDPHASSSELVLLAAFSEPHLILVDDDLADRSMELSRGVSARIVRISHTTRRFSRTSFGLLRRKKKDAVSDDDTYPAVLDRHQPRFETPGEIAEDQTALILFTSGTTSRPKGVELTHRNLWAQFETFGRQYGFDADSRILNHLPMHHTDGLNQGPAAAFHAQATLVRPAPITIQNLPSMMQSVYRERATHLVTVPTVLALMMRLPDEFDDSFDSSEFRMILSTAAYLPDGLWQDVESRFKVTVVNSYGLTETVSEALYCGPTAQTRRLGTVGRPIDCEIQIVDEEGRELPQGEAGELAIRGDNVMKGYFRDAAATGSVFRDDWFLTGDLARIVGEGFVSIVGRRKNVIVRGGVNISPEDVTDAVGRMPGVLDAVTFGLDDELLGERVVACVSLDRDTTIDTEQIIEYCRASLAQEKIPNNILIVDDLPRGPAGKVLLQEVKALARNQMAAMSVQIEGDTESRVFQIAAATFKVPVRSLRVGASHQDTAGWDSLAHLEFILTLEKQFDVRLGPRDIMNIANLDDAVNVITAKLPAV